MVPHRDSFDGLLGVAACLLGFLFCLKDFHHRLVAAADAAALLVVAGVVVVGSTGGVFLAHTSPHPASLPLFFPSRDPLNDDQEALHQ